MSFGIDLEGSIDVDSPAQPRKRSTVGFQALPSRKHLNRKNSTKQIQWVMCLHCKSSIPTAADTCPKCGKCAADYLDECDFPSEEIRLRAEIKAVSHSDTKRPQMKRHLAIVLYQHAIKLMNENTENDPKKGKVILPLLKEAAKNYPYNLEIAIKFSYFAISCDAFEDIEHILKRALRHSPSATASQKARALTNYACSINANPDDHRYELAESVARDGLRWSDSPQLYVNLAQTLEHQQRYDEAIQALETAKKKGAPDPQQLTYLQDYIAYIKYLRHLGKKSKKDGRHPHGNKSTLMAPLNRGRSGSGSSKKKNKGKEEEEDH